MKLKILLPVIFLANIALAQDSLSKDYYIKGIEIRCPGGPGENNFGIENSLSPRFETYFGTSFSSNRLFGNYYGISMMQYNNMLKGDISFGICNESFNNKMNVNSIYLGYSKTIKIADNFFITPGIQFNYSTLNGQYPYSNNLVQPITRALIR